jgi:hypothetical protein
MHTLEVYFDAHIFNLNNQHLRLCSVQVLTRLVVVKLGWDFNITWIMVKYDILRIATREIVLQIIIIV